MLLFYEGGKCNFFMLFVIKVMGDRVRYWDVIMYNIWSCFVYSD